jgi:Dullard-like phosphatase family protein
MTQLLSRGRDTVFRTRAWLPERLEFSAKRSSDAMTAQDESELIAHTPSAGASLISGHAPALVPVEFSAQKKLVLDLDETLVHSSLARLKNCDFTVFVDFKGRTFEIYVIKRPGVDLFLAEVIGLYDVFFFSASLPEYCFAVVKALVPGFPRAHVLSRDNCRFHNGIFVKDLTIFKCDMKDILIVDNAAVSYSFQPENGILIGSWIGDTSDNELLTTTLPILRRCQRAGDVRVTLANTII